MNAENTENAYTGLEIAVIGAAGRFPGASNLDQYWENITNGIDTITFFSDDELETEGINPELLNNPNFIKAKGILDDIQYFDSSFFNYTSSQADTMDPQLRIYHECAWAALEDAGYNPEHYSKLIGVYSGASVNIAWVNALEKISHRLEVPIYDNESSYANRISYSLNLKGPSFIVLSASATSLLAIHVACQGLLNAECDMALAGGVYVAPKQKTGTFSRSESGSNPGGHCRAFDAKASGAVVGEGVGIVVLKRLEDAEADKDNIYAIIKGSAVTNDGSGKIGFQVPSMEGQAEAIRIAHEVADVEPETVTYVEAHGSSSLLADSFEVKALQAAFNSSKQKFCAIGSVKTNIGYLNYAAGIAGFIKTVLALKHAVIPPSLHFETPNPQIDFNNSPFYVNTKLKPWNREHTPRRAGVKAFGTGGTNVYVILEEWQYPSPTNPETSLNTHKESYLLPLSARTSNQLEHMKQNLVNFLETHQETNLANAAYTLQNGRKHFNYRSYLMSSTIEETSSSQWSSFSGTGKTTNSEILNKLSLYFIFPQLTSSIPATSLHQQLYTKETQYRAIVDQCTEHLQTLSAEIPGLNTTIQNQRIHQFIFSYALAKLMVKWGIHPNGLIGLGNNGNLIEALKDQISIREALENILKNTKEDGSSDEKEALNGIPKEEKAILINFATQRDINSMIPIASSHQIVNLFNTAEQGTQGTGESSYNHLLHQIGRLWCYGININWNALQNQLKMNSSRISLPTYPFEKECHWVIETIE